MLYYALVFFIIALVAALFGFGGIAGESSALILKELFSRERLWHPPPKAVDLADSKSLISFGSSPKAV